MENKGAAIRIDIGQSKGGAEVETAQGDVISEVDLYSAKDNVQVHAIDPQSARDISQKEAPRHCDDPSMEVNMEATINPEDVVRAGGFGARDDISSFLPIASDSTDFEASLLDARDYEEPQGEKRRPGLGWREDSVSE